MLCRRTWFVGMALWASVASQSNGHRNILLPSSLPPLTPPKRYSPPRRRVADDQTLVSSIRGGGLDTRRKTRPTKRRSAKKLQRAVEQDEVIPTKNARGNIHSEEARIQVRSVLVPRQTSFLTPLRFLSFLLMNASFGSCMQTAGKPLEDAVRRTLGMSSPGTDDDDFSARVTPLHVYLARKIASSPPSSATPGEVLPPGHLPSPLPLLGLFGSVLLYVGGTVLLPRWNVEFDVLLNYEQFDMIGDDEKRINNAGHALQNWFDENQDDDVDPYYSSSSRKLLTPAVLVCEIEASGKSRQTVCPLFYSPGYDESVEEAQDDHPRHPRCYYFELDQKRYYFDPMNAAHDNHRSLDVVSGGPSLHDDALAALLSDSYTRGLCSRDRLAYAKERYSPYSDITIPVPSLRGAFSRRIGSPLVTLQLLGRLLSLLEEESVGRALSNLARLGIQHLIDAKRSIASAVALAEEVQGIDQTDGDNGRESRFWAVRPKHVTTTKKRNEGRAESEWVQVSPKELFPGDVFVIAPAASHANPSLAIPVDALLLDGTCVTEEAALTGESVPQAKVPLDFAADGGDDVDSSPKLDMDGIHRSSCVFAGTTLLHSSNWDGGTASTSKAMSNLPPLPRETLSNNETLPAMFLTLCTGSYSSRGNIIQSFLKSRMDTGVSSRENEIDSIRLIGVLALFAVGACLFLLLDSSDAKHGDSVFKKIVQCTRIVVASVPSDLPASLSACAYACSKILRDESDAVNSEAGALLESSKVDTIVFDKTGTLTADTEALASIAYPPCQPRTTNYLAQVVLAGGHTLIGMGGGDNNLAGDPVDLAGLRYTLWKYNPHEKSAASFENNVKLWQLCSFPFDPVKKMSSALVLVRNNDGVFRLWVVVKGSPTKIRDLVQFENEDNGGITQHWYDKKVKRLGKLGYRSIGLGASDVTAAADVMFPLGLPSPNDGALETRIREARRLAKELFVRDDIERQSSSILNANEMMFVGFAFFNAPMRSSSLRVVKQLKSSVNVVMLTGDEPNASFSVAKKAGITHGGKSRMCLLKTNDLNKLEWEVNGKRRRFSLENARAVQVDVEQKKAVLVLTGDAVSALLRSSSATRCYDNAFLTSAPQFVLDQLLPQTSLIASASPNDKSSFVQWLQNSCKRRVLMCGDGVNDIAAMKEATVSVAMLSGFGQESDMANATDEEDMRRKERLRRRRIGSNRQKLIKKLNPTFDEAGVGNSLAASCVRIQRDIIKGMRKLQTEGTATPHHTSAFVVLLASIRKEMKRYQDMKKGGSNAAKILAEEDRLQRSLKTKATAQFENTEADLGGIKTGESCLASSFTLLRPCISGVESILRTGVSASACGISLYRKVALYCILSCYNLATLYKNGLRYGKWLWQVELCSLVFTDRASFTASSTPRPRLTAGVRPSTTPFHSSEVISTTLQAIIHISLLTCAVNAGRQLEVTNSKRVVHKGFNIQWNDNGASAGSLLSTLVGSSGSNSLHLDTDAPPHTLKKSRFQPNFISNNVFIMSVFQNAVTAMVNHKGRPFCVSFLESRPFCLSVTLTFLLCIVCIGESIPMFNRFIQLAPYPTKASRIEMFRLLLLDLSLSHFAEYLSTFFFRHDIWKEKNKPFHTSHDGLATASEMEEKLLSEERQQNFRMVSIICFLIFLLSMEMLKTPMKV